MLTTRQSSGIAVAVVLASVSLLRAQTWDAGDASDPTNWFDLDNWNPNVLPGLGSMTADTSGNASCSTECLRITYTSKPAAVPPLPDPGIGSFHAQSPAGSIYRFQLTRDSDPDNVNFLTTTTELGNFYHDGAGRYRIQIDAASELRIGDPEGQFGPLFASVDADLYGFELDLDGDLSTDVQNQFTIPAVVRVTHVLG